MHKGLDVARKLSMDSKEMLVIIITLHIIDIHPETRVEYRKFLW